MKVRNLFISLCFLLSPISETFGRSAPIITGFGAFPLHITGLEKWDIDGKIYEITSSYYLVSDSRIQFAMEVQLGVEKSIKKLNQLEALEVTLPVIKHAFLKNFHLRKTFKSIGSLPPAEVHSITAVLFQHDGVTTRVVRISLPIDDLKTYDQPRTSQSDESLSEMLVGSWVSDPAHREKDYLPHISQYNPDGTLTYKSYSDKACTKQESQSFGTWSIKDGYLNITTTGLGAKDEKTPIVITDQIVKIDKNNMELIAVNNLSKEPRLLPYHSPRIFRKRSDKCY